MPALIYVLLISSILLTPDLRAEDRTFRTLIVACDAPGGLRLTIDDKTSPSRFPTGKVTNLSSFQASSYKVRAEVSGLPPYMADATLDPKTIHTWIFYTSTLSNQPVEGEQGETEQPTETDKKTLRLLDITAPDTIGDPKTVLVDLTGDEEGIDIFLNGIPHTLLPETPLALPPLVEGSTAVLSSLLDTAPGVTPTTFFQDKLKVGTHAIIAIYRNSAGQLAAAMKVL